MQTARPKNQGVMRVLTNEMYCFLAGGIIVTVLGGLLLWKVSLYIKFVNNKSLLTKVTILSELREASTRKIIDRKI